MFMTEPSPPCVFHLGSDARQSTHVTVLGGWFSGRNVIRRHLPSAGLAGIGLPMRQGDQLMLPHGTIH